MAINYTLSRKAAEELFEEEAILFGEVNGVPEFRIVEIFGEWAGVFVEQNLSFGGYLEGGRDWNGWNNLYSDTIKYDTFQKNKLA